MSGYRGNRLYAVDLSSARGDISRGGAIVWSLDRDTPYVPSPVVHDGILYFTKSNSGILSAYDAATGQNLYGPVRLSGIRDVYASPVIAGGRLYVTSRERRHAGREGRSRIRDPVDEPPRRRFRRFSGRCRGEIYLRGRAVPSTASPPT